jgi:hypothetical protein
MAGAPHLPPPASGRHRQSSALRRTAASSLPAVGVLKQKGRARVGWPAVGVRRPAASVSPGGGGGGRGGSSEDGEEGWSGWDGAHARQDEGGPQLPWE